MDSPKTIVEARELSRIYGTGSTAVHALRSVAFSVAEGQFLTIMGPSGSGKSTLLHLLGCLDRPTTGHLIIDGEDVADHDDAGLSTMRGAKLGFVFQSFNLIPQLDVQANVELPMVYTRVEVSHRRERASAVLRLMGLEERTRHRPTELSGGQAQRVAIARALVNRPRLLLADEPTGNLDSETGLSIMSLFQALNRAGLTVIMVTHDTELAALSSRILRVRDGAIESDLVVAEPRRLIIEDELAARIAAFWGRVEKGASACSGNN